MRKIVRSLSLFAVIAAVMAAAGSATVAQEKKTTKAAAGTIEIGEGKDGKFRFTIRDGEGKYLGGTAVGYATKDDAIKAVETLKAVLATGKIVDGKKAEPKKEEPKKTETKKEEPKKPAAK